MEKSEKRDAMEEQLAQIEIELFLEKFTEETEALTKGELYEPDKRGTDEDRIRRWILLDTV